jgi:protein TonB
VLRTVAIVGISVGIAALTSCGKEAELLTPPAEVKQTTIFSCGFEVMPMFSGGQKALMEYLAANVRYPDTMEDTCAQGRVVVSFVVERDGSITEPKVVKSVHSALDEEALRVVNGMPKWIPGSQNGERVRTRYTIPITFKLQ